MYNPVCLTGARVLYLLVDCMFIKYITGQSNLEVNFINSCFHASYSFVLSLYCCVLLCKRHFVRVVMELG